MSERPNVWPADVSPIGIEDLGRLGLDPANRLFWDGKRIEVRQSLSLTRMQKVFAVIVSICAILGGVGGFITGLNNASVFLCTRGHFWLSCSVPAPHP